jgi:hypothetical protein
MSVVLGILCQQHCPLLLASRAAPFSHPLCVTVFLYAAALAAGARAAAPAPSAAAAPSLDARQGAKQGSAKGRNKGVMLNMVYIQTEFLIFKSWSRRHQPALLVPARAAAARAPQR